MSEVLYGRKLDEHVQKLRITYKVVFGTDVALSKVKSQEAWYTFHHEIFVGIRGVCVKYFTTQNKNLKALGILTLILFLNACVVTQFKNRDRSFLYHAVYLA